MFKIAILSGGVASSSVSRVGISFPLNSDICLFLVFLYCSRTNFCFPTNDDRHFVYGKPFDVLRGSCRNYTTKLETKKRGKKFLGILSVDFPRNSRVSFDVKRRNLTPFNLRTILYFIFFFSLAKKTRTRFRLEHDDDDMGAVSDRQGPTPIWN